MIVACSHTLGHAVVFCPTVEVISPLALASATSPYSLPLLPHSAFSAVPTPLHMMRRDCVSCARAVWSAALVLPPNVSTFSPPQLALALAAPPPPPGLHNVIVVDNVPVITPEKIEKLTNALRKVR